MSSPKIKHELVSKFGTEYGPEEERAVLEVLRAGAPTSGDWCVRFEHDFAAWCGTSHARVTTNGTASLFLALIAVGVKPGDKVLTTPLTWIATAAAASTLGAEVDFVDVDPVTYNMSAERLAEKITPETKAVLPVHLYGQCCDMDEILALAKENGTAVVEDACHALGAQYKGRMAGSMGDAGAFSFHEQKNISTLGEGGIVVTNSAEVYEQVALYRSHCARVYGASTKYCTLDEERFPQGKRFWWQDFDDTGYNFRMTDIQAAVGIEQLKKMDALNARRIANAKYLDEHLADVPGLKLPVTAPDRNHVYHLYPMQIDASQYGMSKEDFVYRMLHEKGVRIGTHYIPLHWSTAYRKRGFAPGQFPVADALAETLVTLPIHPRQTEEGLAYLVSSIRDLHS